MILAGDASLIDINNLKNNVELALKRRFLDEDKGVCKTHMRKV